MNGPSAFTQVIEYFRNHQRSFQTDRGNRVLRAGFRGAHAEFRVAVTVNESDDLIEAIGILPIVAPPAKRAQAAELCAYLSWGMRIGRFEMNPADGETRFHASSTYSSGELAESVIQSVVGVTLVMSDEHFPAFVRVICGNESPAAVTRHIHEQIRNRQNTASHPALTLAARLDLN
jgi:hypothetical protein